jgi:hypothetical protein
MFFDIGFFTRYMVSAPGESVAVGDGKRIPVAGRGSVSFYSRLPNGGRTVVLHGVKHVPSLTANLISLGQLERAGASGSFGGGAIRVAINGEELFRAELMSVNLYRVDLFMRGDSVAYVAGSSGSLRLWHRRMGHLNLDAIRRLASKNMVDGLIISAQNTYDHVCEGCALGKSHRQPLPKASTTKLLEDGACRSRSYRSDVC